MACEYHPGLEQCACLQEKQACYDSSDLMLRMEVDTPLTPSIPIAAPSTWLATFISLREAAKARAAERLSFKLFMELPREVRNGIYTYVLSKGQPILPQLCDSEVSGNDKPTFHDNSHWDHAGMLKLTSLTRTNRELREESLPVFYAANSFAVGPDTTTYFAYLQSLSRLDWVLNVDIVIHCGPAERAAWVLRCVNQFDEEGDNHLRNGLLDGKKEVKGQRTWKGEAGETTMDLDACGGEQKALSTLLMLHPRYHVGGFTDLNLAILLRLLSTAASPDSPYTRRIVLPVSNISAFETNSSLRWFPALVHGLGIELRFVEHPNSATLQDRDVYLQWNRRFQGQDVETVAGGKNEAMEADVMERTLEMFPQLEQMRRPEKTCFYRKSCVSDQLTWFDMSTLGGAHSGSEEV